FLRTNAASFTSTISSASHEKKSFALAVTGYTFRSRNASNRAGDIDGATSRHRGLFSAPCPRLPRISRYCHSSGSLRLVPTKMVGVVAYTLTKWSYQGSLTAARLPYCLGLNVIFVTPFVRHP